MSTPNFHNKNASKIYAVELEEEWDYSDLVSNIQSELKDYSEKDYSDNDRNYPATCITEKAIAKGNWIVTIKAMVRGGYYSGANLDWETEVENEKEYNYYELSEAPRYINSMVERQITKLEKVFQSYSTPLICVGIFSNGEAVYKKANA